MFFILIATFLIGLIGFWVYNYFYYYGYLKKIPSPTVLPLIGNVLVFRHTKNFVFDVEAQLKKYKSKSLRIHLPLNTTLITKDYNVIEYLLSNAKLINKGFEYNYFKNWLGISVFTSSGNRWHSKRKMLIPTFHFKILEQFHGVFNSNGQVLVNKLRKLIAVQSFDVYPLLTLCTLDIICETAMGTSVNAQLENTSEYVQAINRIGHIISERTLKPIYSSDFLYQFTSLYHEEMQLYKIIHGYHNKIIHNRRTKFLEQQELQKSNKNKDDLAGKKNIPFLDLLFQTTIDGEPISHQKIANEVATFMVAGHDTISGALSFALYILSKNPEIQQKCVEELQGIFGHDKECPSTLADIHQLKYLELVIKETLRLYPPAPLYTRTINESFEVDGITYPKGITIGVHAYGIHHDEDIYENPEKFDPERFSVERYDGKKPFAFIPFSAGPRNCIGQKFAWLELKTLLSMILRNFVVIAAVPNHELHLTAAVILRSSTGINIALEERKY